MKRFQIFLSHCAGEGIETVIIDRFYQLLCEAFHHEKEERQSVAIEYDGQTPLHAGDELRQGCVEKINNSNLVICCFFPRYLEARYFEAEVKAALNQGKPIVEIRFVPLGERPYKHIEQLDKRLVETQGSGRPLRVVINIQYDPADSTSATESLRKYVAGGDLVDRIRRQILDCAERDLTMFETAQQVLDDLADNPTTWVRFFLYDGGTTLRKLQENVGFEELLRTQRENLDVDFLYVDTACKTYLSKTPEYEDSAALQAMDDGAYSAVYEALCRRSGLVHNESPHGHIADVAKSIKTLQALQKEYKFQLSIRKTCQLPIYRLIITQHYVYYTHIFPRSTFDPERGASDYYSLRLSTESGAGKTLTKHYEHLWKSGVPEQLDS